MTNKKIYPFKFLNAYTREDKDIFFGREEEIDALYEMVFQTDLLLVYGASGTGKTSLIQCGLASRFQSHDWLALNIRRGKNLNDAVEKAIKAAGNSPTQTQPAEDLDWLDEADEKLDNPPSSLSPLAEQLKSVYLKHFKPIYLIFDQFEELYILGEKDEQEKFMETVREILRVEQPVKIIFSIREEYLGYLYEFERKVPELLHKKLRVEPMNLDKAKTVITQIGKMPNSLVHLKAGETEKLAEGIFEKTKDQVNTRTIQLPYLQVFMDKFYRQICGDENHQTEVTFSLAELEKMGNIGNVLRDFLDEQVLKIAHNFQTKPEKIWDVLKPFVTGDGTKEPLRVAELTAQFETKDRTFVKECLQAFVNSRILRFNENEERYEIAHDSLAKQIHAQRSDEEIALLEVQNMIKSQVSLKGEAREFFTGKQLQFIDEYLGKLKLTPVEEQYLAESRKEVKSRTIKRRKLVLAILIFLSMVTSWALFNQFKTKAALEETEIAKIEVQKERDNAKNALKTIEKNRKIKIAEELKAFGDSYFDLGKITDANQTYLAARDSLEKLKNIDIPYADLPIFIELNHKIQLTE